MKTVSASEAAATGLIKGAHVAPETSASAADKLEAAKRAAAKINLKNTPKGKASITGPPLVQVQEILLNLSIFRNKIEN